MAERGYTGTRLDDIAEAAGLEGFIAGLVKDENAADGDGPAVKMAFDRRLQDPREPAKALMAGALKARTSLTTIRRPAVVVRSARDE